MHVQLKSGKLLNSLIIEDVQVGFHDKKIVVIFLTNGTKIIEKYDTPEAAESAAQELKVKLISAGSGGGSGTGGVTDHNLLTGKNSPNQHSIAAITGLQKELDSKAEIHEYKKDTKYEKDNLVYVDGKICRVVRDYTSTTLGSDTKEAFEKDIEDGELLPICNCESGGGGSLTEDILSNITVGAAPAGTLFPKGTDLTELAKKLLLTEVAPTISTTFPSNGTYEKGKTLNNIRPSLSITNLSKVTLPIVEIKFYQGNTLLETIPFVAGQSNYQLSTGKAIATIDSDTTLKAVLTYKTSKTGTATKNLDGTGSYKFIYAEYFGVVDAAYMPDSSHVSAWVVDNTTGSKVINGNTFWKYKSGTKGCTVSNITLNDQCFMYMYPATLGALTSIKDGNGFEQKDGYSSGTFQITTTNGDTVDYLVYILTDPTTGTGFKQIYV